MNPFQTNSEEEICLLAAKHFRRQAERLSAQFDGIRDGTDMECIHRARVASRRLRAGLRMFHHCLKPEVYTRWRKHVRRITSGLGDARDRDVQIEFLCLGLCDLDDASLFPGVAKLLAELGRERDRLQPKVVKSVDRFERGKVLDEMRGALDAVRGRSSSAEETPQRSAVYRTAEEQIGAQLDELLLHEDGLADPQATAEHHAMRIAVKRLRYTLEIVKSSYRGTLDDMLRTTKRIQTLLGDIHDCDVWVERLAAFEERQRQGTVKHYGHEGPFARLAPGIEHLQQARACDREHLFHELVEYWAELRRDGVWDRLRHLAELPDAPPAVTALPDRTPGPPETENSIIERGNGRSLEASLAAHAQNPED